MARTDIETALHELANAATSQDKKAWLRRLKNELVGHTPKKALAIHKGAVKPLVETLSTGVKKGGKRRSSVLNGNGFAAANGGESTLDWGIDDDVRLQATQIVSTLAYASRANSTALVDGGVLTPLIDTLMPDDTHPRLIITTLCSIIQIVQAIPEGPSWAALCQHILYTEAVLSKLSRILVQPPDAVDVQEEIALVSRLIVAMRPSGNWSKALVDAGVLARLTTLLAEQAQADAHSFQRKSAQQKPDTLSSMCLADVLEAIAVIIQDSHYTTALFLYSQPIRRVFEQPDTSDRSQVGDSGEDTPQSCWKDLVPQLPPVHNKPDKYSTTWPPLSMGGWFESRRSLSPNLANEEERPLFMWLMALARRDEGSARLSACWLLALLKKCTDQWPLDQDTSTATRDQYFASLVLPLVIELFKNADAAAEQLRKLKAPGPELDEENMFILERAPLVLAYLMQGNTTMQKAAAEAKMAPLLIQVLKKTFEPITGLPRPMWTPNPSPAAETESENQSVRPRPVAHALKVRENVLRALAAFADNSDHHRKEVMAVSGATSTIVSCFVPLTSESIDHWTRGGEAHINMKEMGNPPAVLVAACRAARSLSRSVSILRTDLIDNGLAKPCFELLTHPDINVQIAATEVITNLVLELSPMRDDITKMGVSTTLCKNCHSSNFALQHASIWAMKHLILHSHIDLKRQYFEELGIDWLLQKLSDNTSSRNAPSSSLGMGTSNAAGEQVDLLNAVEEPQMEVDGREAPDDEDGNEDDDQEDFNGVWPFPRHQDLRFASRKVSIPDLLQQIQTEEEDQAVINKRDRIRIQVHCLDFLRNFISDAKGMTGEAVERLLSLIPHDKFFGVIDAKLRPEQTSGAASSGSSFGSGSGKQDWSRYPHTELIAAAVYVLTHVATGHAQHKRLLMEQTQLMRHILPLFQHPSRDVRITCIWLLNNLTWTEDGPDRDDARQRVLKLYDMGFETAAKKLLNDEDLDVRERAKTGLAQMRLFTEGMGSGGGAGGLRMGLGELGMSGSGLFGGSGGSGDGDVRRFGGGHRWPGGGY